MGGAVYKVVAGEKEAEKNDSEMGMGLWLKPRAIHTQPFLPPGKLLAQAP